MKHWFVHYERFLLDFLLQCRFKEFKQQILFTLIRCVVVQCKNHRVHKLSGLILGHLKNKLGQVRGIGLK